MFLDRAQLPQSGTVFKSLCNNYFESGGGFKCEGVGFRFFFIAFLVIAFSDRELNSKNNGAKKNWGQNLKFLKKSILVFGKCAIWLF